MALKCWAAVYGRPAPPPRTKRSEAAILVASVRNGAARRLVLVANAYVQPRGRADAFEVTAGCCGRARHHRLRIRDFDLSRKMGPHDKFPGPCASTAPGVVSREVVSMSCGLRRAPSCGDDGTGNDGGRWGEVARRGVLFYLCGKCDRCTAELQIPPSTSHDPRGELWLVLSGI